MRLHPARAAGLLRAPWTPAWAKDELSRRARAVPSLDLRFAENKSLVDSVSGQNLITFTRASTGTYVDSDGVIRSAANDVPRFNHNPLTGECLGLLVEEQRQNLLLNSATLSTQTVTVTAVAHTLSFYGTGTVTLSGTSTAGPLVGTAANSRVSLTFTPTAGSLTLTVSGSVTNANLEIGSFATSWIPTTGTAATRTADVASITGTNFSSWYRQDEGTLFADVANIQNGGRYFMFDNGASITERWETRFSSFLAAGNSWSNNVQDVSINTSLAPAPPALNVRVAFANASNAAAIASNGAGALLGTDSSSTMPANQTRMFIGSFQGTATYANGPIRRITYFPQRLPNSTLQSITQ
jgi:hypothetical protein